MSVIRAEGLVIDWTQMPTYNTIMSVMVGAGLLTLVWLGRDLQRGRIERLDTWALALAVPGLILASTGLHMTLTWPLAAYFPFDNIIFGETSLGFGVLLLAGAFFLWKRGAELLASPDPAARLAAAARPFSLAVIGLGLSLVAIMFAGLVFQLFAAPPEEPISGAFAEYPWVEAIFMSGLFGLVGVGAVLFPFSLRGFSATGAPSALQRVVGVVWGLAGAAFLLFGAMNFFTHIGLIINTMG